jgi:hypothetical protein
VLFSRKEAILHELRALRIHGALFYDIVYTYADQLDPRRESARISDQMIYPNAQEGDRVFVEKIANVVMRVEKL